MNSAGHKWQKVDGNLTWISSGCPGDLWGISAEGHQVLRRHGVTVDKATGTNWEPMGRSMVQLDAICGDAWGISDGGELSHISLSGKLNLGLSYIFIICLSSTSRAPPQS